MEFEVKTISWPWQGQEELTLKPTAEGGDVIEVKLLFRGESGKKVGDKMRIELPKK